MRRRWAWGAATLLLSVGLAVGLAPTRTAAYGSCGPAVVWLFADDDPTGPDDPPGTYDEYLACADSSSGRALLSAGLLAGAALASGVAVAHPRRRSRRRAGTS